MDLMQRLSKLARLPATIELSRRDRDAFYKSREWTRLSIEVKVRDNFECQICKDRGGLRREKLITHHIKPLTNDYDKRLDKDNLITVCHACHNTLHYNNVTTTKWDDERW